MFEISDQVEQKLRDKHGVEFDEVVEAFINHTGHNVKDNREQHQTVPPTEWFISETDEGRRLKVVFIFRDGTFVIKTAYEPSPDEEQLYAETT